jgi:hypothetical protein
MQHAKAFPQVYPHISQSAQAPLAPWAVWAYPPPSLVFSPVLVLKYTAILITAMSEIRENAIWTENVIGHQIMVETGNRRIVNVSTSVNNESESQSQKTEIATTTIAKW